MMTGQLRNWKDTKLWQQLDKTDSPEAAEVRKTLDNCMKDIQGVLQQGGTSRTDFTLHDAQHSFRVAELMTELIPDDVLPELACYELGLLLLSAYLHDVGMSPEQERTFHYHAYLLTGDKETLSEQEAADFQRWLDEEMPEIMIPLAEGTPTPSELKQANLLITHYCRARHVAWGVDWINQHLADETLGTYAQWVDDLKALCRSHHQGYSSLILRSFDPKPVGTGMVVHLRYLAAVLRVADVLDFDPERTPQVIFRHRDIDPGSEIYWHKDQNVTPRMEGGRLTIAAEPPDARIHRAIQLMSDEIERELRLVRHLSDERSFADPGFPSEPLPHRWDLLPDVHRRIRPRNEAYEYIDGAFRPDTEKLLHLLSGTALYKHELAAVRELLQNSFDAVREQLAYERLVRPDPANPEWEDRLAPLHSVELRLKHEEGRTWLICRDDGVGMSKTIIENYLLISGVTQRADMRQLERRCRAAGFEFVRTAQFGIGVLSYFMMADLVQIYTRRSNLAEDTDPNGWFFETEGIGAFGELRRDDSWHQGTEVRLRLKEEFIRTLSNEDTVQESNDVPAVLGRAGDRTHWLADRLVDYLREVLRYLPCDFNFFTEDEIENAEPLTFKQGWRLLNPTEQIRANNSVTSVFGSEYYNALNWRTIEGELPDSLGRFRFHIPEFDLPLGWSPYFLRAEQIDNRIVVSSPTGAHGDASFLLHESATYMSWKGMQVEADTRDPFDLFLTSRNGVLFECDWRSNAVGALSASRERITIDRTVLSNAAEAVKAVLEQALLDRAEENRDSPFATLALIHLGPFEATSESRATWLYVDTVEDLRASTWGPLVVPAVIDILGVLAEEGKKRLALETEKVHIAKDLRVQNSRWGGGVPVPLWQGSIVPDRVVKCTLRRTPSLPIWLQAPASENNAPKLFAQCEFPPDWSHLAGLQVYQSFSRQDVWNRDHPICDYREDKMKERLAHEERDTEEAPEFPENLLYVMYRYGYGQNTPQILQPEDFPSDEIAQVLLNRERVILWLYQALMAGNSAFWTEVTEMGTEFLTGVWQLLFEDTVTSATEPALYTLHVLSGDRDIGSGTELRVYKPSSYESIRGAGQIESYLPDPGAEWTLHALP